jgi:REP-associated tyrosine transposase
MVEYRTSAHAVYDIKYHLVWITKYRYKILCGRVAERARDLLRQICQARSGGSFPQKIAVVLENSVKKGDAR